MRDAQIKAYRAALAAHDWYFAHSDDRRAWTKGNAQRASLQQQRKELDPDGLIWDEYAPDAFKINRSKS